MAKRRSLVEQLEKAATDLAEATSIALTGSTIGMLERAAEADIQDVTLEDARTRAEAIAAAPRRRKTPARTKAANPKTTSPKTARQKSAARKTKSPMTTGLKPAGAKAAGTRPAKKSVKRATGPKAAPVRPSKTAAASATRPTTPRKPGGAKKPVQSAARPHPSKRPAKTASRAAPRRTSSARRPRR